MLGGCARHRGVTGGIVGDPNLPRWGLPGHLAPLRTARVRYGQMKSKRTDQRTEADLWGPICPIFSSWSGPCSLPITNYSFHASAANGNSLSSARAWKE